jgi:hypothetical protein
MAEPSKEEGLRLPMPGILDMSAKPGYQTETIRARRRTEVADEVVVGRRADVQAGALGTCRGAGRRL